MINLKNLKEADVLILAASWPEWSVSYVVETLKKLEKFGSKKIFIVGMKNQNESGVKVLRLANKGLTRHEK